jgi:hypothetical protein
VSRCHMELCPDWTGDGNVCPCALIDQWVEAERCEADYNPDGGNSGVCLARLNSRGECTRMGGHGGDDL